MGRTFPSPVLCAIAGLFWGLGAAGAAVAGTGSALDVPLTIQEAAGVERKAEPCSTGLPLPCGLLKEPEGIALFDAAGRAVPAQFRVLERWREEALGRGDLSIKWLLVTFLADVPAGGKAVYRLKSGQNPAPAAPATVEDQADAFRMAGLTIKKDFSQPFQLVLTDPEGKTLTAADLPVTATVWENGPVRACIRAESPTVPGKFGFIAWLYGYAGERRWDLTVVLKNTPRQAAGPLYFKDFSVVWSPPGLEGARDFALGGEAGRALSGRLEAGQSASLYQSSDGTDKWDQVDVRNAYVVPWSKLIGLGKPEFRGYRVTGGRGEEAAGNRALGWAALNAGGTGAAAAVRHFRQNYPKAVEVEPGRIVLRLWPKEWQAHGGLHWLDDCQRKAHDLRFAVEAGPVSPAAGDGLAAAFNAPLVAHAPPEWYRAAAVAALRGTPKPTGPDPRDWHRFDDRNWVTFGGDISDRIRRRYHEQSLEGFAGTGNPFSAYILHAAMQHSAGMTPHWMDDYQYPQDTKALTHAQYCGTVRPAGKYREGTEHHGYMAWNHAHFCCQELFDAWRLLGDPLALEAIKGVGAYCQSYVDFREAGGGLVAGTRADGHPLENLCAAYNILGDETMLPVLRRFAEVSWRQVNKERGNYGVMDSWEGGKDRVEKPFMMGQVMGGLRAWYDVSGDERAADQILGMADFILAESSMGEWGFNYVVFIDPEQNRTRLAEATEKARQGGKNVSYGNLSVWMAWAHWYTGEERFRRAVDGINKKAYPYVPYSYTYFYPERADREPPAAVADLAAEALGGGKVRLSWTAPAGGVLRYQAKWAARPMVERLQWPDQKDTHANWWAANHVEGEPRPGSPGARESMVVEGIPAGTASFAVRSFDAANNRSAISNLATVAVR